MKSLIVLAVVSLVFSEALAPEEIGDAPNTGFQLKGMGNPFGVEDTEEKR